MVALAPGTSIVVYLSGAAAAEAAAGATDSAAAARPVTMAARRPMRMWFMTISKRAWGID